MQTFICPYFKHFKASKYAPESPSALKVAPFLTITTLDRELRSEKSNLLPAAVILEKGTPISARAPGPSTLYVIEGEAYISRVYISNPEYFVNVQENLNSRIRVTQGSQSC